MRHTRDQHFQRLNAYRHSREYAQFAARIGNPVPEGDDLPSLLGVRWEIDETIYMEFLEILPPLRWHGGTFLISEFCFDTITTKYTRTGDASVGYRYFCEFFDAKR